MFSWLVTYHLWKLSLITEDQMKKKLPFPTVDKKSLCPLTGKGIRLGFLLASIFVLRTTSFGQDIHFSQYNLTPLLINPAQAGAYRNFEVIANYKTQWTSISPNAFKTMMLNYDGRLMQKKWKKKWLAAGFTIFNDKVGEGDMVTTQANVSIGYHALLSSRSTLGGGLFGGFAQRSINYSNFAWDEQYQNGTYNTSNSTGEVSAQNYQNANKFVYPDVGLGVLYQYTKGEMYTMSNDMVVVHAGLALFHLNQPAYSFYGSSEKLYAKTVGHADILFGVKNTNLSLMPGFIYMRQGPSSEIYSGCFFRYKLQEESKFTGFVKGSALVVGTHIRVGDAFIPSVQLEIAQYTIGVSYDVNISGLKKVTSGKGGFEIALRYGNLSQFLYKSAASFQ
jgi:type IX secretion system PorP/SprF family membrane protein